MYNTVERIPAAYEEERRHARPPTTAADLPLDYEAITPEWLTAVLCRQHPGAKVLSHRLDAPDDGNSNRRRIFIRYNKTGEDAELPASVFCKAVHKLANRISLGMSGAMYCETAFYQKIRPRLSIEAPECFFAAANEAMNSIIMLGDLRGSAIFCSHSTDVTRARIESQLSQLAELHGAFYGSPELKDDLAREIPSWEDFFGRLDYPDMERSCDRGFSLCEPWFASRLTARRGEIWKATRASVRAHRQVPHTLCHGDPHLRNWYIAEHGGMGLNDWQTIDRGHWSRDVVYTITTALTVEHRRAWERDLFDFYLDLLQERAGRSLSREGLFDLYRGQLMTVLAFWTMTICPAPGMPEDMQPKDATVEFLKRIGAAIDDLDAIDAALAY